jgi:hypothetical protein
MRTNDDPNLCLVGDEAKCKKAPYQAPALRVYGAVSQLTAAKGGSMADGNSGMSMT